MESPTKVSGGAAGRKIVIRTQKEAERSGMSNGTAQGGPKGKAKPAQKASPAPKAGANGAAQKAPKAGRLPSATAAADGALPKRRRFLNPKTLTQAPTSEIRDVRGLMPRHRSSAQEEMIGTIPHEPDAVGDARTAHCIRCVQHAIV
jgi:hypothetical protein